MHYRRYLGWEGGCSIVLGLALALVAFPGLLVSYRAWWVGLLFVPATLLALGAFAALRRGVPLGRPGRWLTERPLGGAAADREGLDERPLIRRLVLETTLWIVGVTVWVVLARSSGLLIFGTGLASAAFGAVQAFPARARVGARERLDQSEFLVSQRPGLGTPTLAVRPAA